MPILAMAEPAVDHQRRFQAAVDVIHNLPKNGSYRPSYEVMLCFHSLYKQAVCGPCMVPWPGFWDPVGHYKWDERSRLGNSSTYLKIEGEEQETSQESLESSDPAMELNMPDDEHLPPTNNVPKDSGMSEGLSLTSEPESEIFCDSVDSVEQLSNIKGTHLEARLDGRQLRAGQGGEGAEDGKCQGPPRRGREDNPGSTEAQRGHEECHGQTGGGGEACCHSWLRLETMSAVYSCSFTAGGDMVAI
ncbi:hypothetical protein GOODEAATRI_009921 [Goodea atripinnis]|uniref:ACB domain-containing protein n=1 Tax=Goodea atripinnis TaxID=208336 RepID=A0ABV0MQS6_9TELE